MKTKLDGETPKKSLKSLEEHNRQALEIFNNQAKTGFACPNCGEELFYVNNNTVLTSYPPQKLVECLQCTYKGSIYY